MLDSPPKSKSKWKSEWLGIEIGMAKSPEVLGSWSELESKSELEWKFESIEESSDWILWVFGWEKCGSEIKIGMGDSHSNRLIGRSPIPISIPLWNRNGSIYIKLNSYSPLWIQIFISILISIPVTNQTLQRIWLFRFWFQAIPILIPILISIIR